MYAGNTDEKIHCPICNKEHWKSRFEGEITCESCGAVFNFSKLSQNLLLAVIALVMAVAAASFITINLLGPLGGLVVALLGTVVVFGLLLYQSAVPQADLIKSAPISADSGHANHEKPSNNQF